MSKVLTRREVAEKLCVSAYSLDKLRKDGKFPPPLEYSEHPKWLEETIDNWLKKIYSSTSSFITEGAVMVRRK